MYEVGSIPQKRIVVGTILTTLAVTAFFLAQGGTRLLAMNVIDLDPAAKVNARGGPPISATSFPRRVDVETICQQNIFDKSREPILKELPPVSLSDPTDGEPPDPTQACTGGMRLVASVYSPGNPDWSVAAIVGSSGGSSSIYRKGMEVEGAGELLGIEPHSVSMRQGAGACTLAMFEPEGSTQAPRSTVVQKPSSPISSADKDEGGGLSKEEMDAGIEKVSDTKFIIQRSVVDKVLANQASLMRTARVIPHEEDGRVVGVKLYGIRRSSLLGRLGLQNGDMLRTINGFDMTSPDTALEAYARLRSASNITVSLSRRGKPMTIEHVIQ